VKAERSRHVVLVTPPAVERAGQVWASLAPGHGPGDHPPGPGVVVVCADHEQAAEWAAAAPAEYRAHAVTGLARSTALLKEGRIGLLAGAAAELATLVARSALKLDAVDTIVLAWPETFSDSLDALLAEAPEARRIVLSWNPPALADFIERHARRAEIVGALPFDADGKPLSPACSARYAVVSTARRAAAVREALDALRAARPYIWTGGAVIAPGGGADAVICAALPTREELAALAAIGKPVVLITSSQLPYLKAVAALTPLTLAPVADRAQDRAEVLRARISEHLERGNVDAELITLEPLFERWDPAEVAAALLALSRQPSAVSDEADLVTAAPDQWVKVFVTVGKKDRAGAKDLVGALIKEVGLEKGQIGRIDLRENFALVEVAPAAADTVVRRLTGVTIKGKRVAARLDRGT
jgi:ATP-dependent RNA helicase DeaD